MRSLSVLFLLTVVACDRDAVDDTSDPTDTADPTDTEDTSSPTDTEDDPNRPDEFVNTWTGSDNGSDPLPSGPADFVYYGNLADGDDSDRCDWGTTYASWPGTICAEYSGAHVWYDVDQPQYRDIYVRLTPSDGFDLNLYTFNRASGDTAKPPDARRGSGGDSWQMFGKQGTNPGQPEVLCTYTSDFQGPYNTLVGVAGAFGETEGHFKIEIWDRPASLCDGD